MKERKSKTYHYLLFLCIDFWRMMGTTRPSSSARPSSMLLTPTTNSLRLITFEKIVWIVEA